MTPIVVWRADHYQTLYLTAHQHRYIHRSSRTDGKHLWRDPASDAAKIQAEGGDPMRRERLNVVPTLSGSILLPGR